MLRYPGVGGRQEYAEGVHVGHRWYDAQQVAPLFPFGHGLSYTTWQYEKLTVRPGGARADGGGLRVEFTVRNTGRRKGTEVAQVYVGPSPELKLDQPVRALVEATGGSPSRRARRSGSPWTWTPGRCRPGTRSSTPGSWAGDAGRCSRAGPRANCH